jgi:hypothetical protein
VPLRSTRGLVVSLSPFKGPGALSRGNQPSPAQFPLSCPRVCAIARRSKVALPPSHPAIGSYLPGPLRCHHAHTSVRHVAPNLPKPFPVPRGPQRALALVSGGPPPWARAAPLLAAREPPLRLAIRSPTSISDRMART